MALDPSISLGYRPPQVNLDVPSPIQQFGQMMSLRGLMEQQQMRRMQMAQQQMEMDTARRSQAAGEDFRKRMLAGEQMTPSQVLGTLGPTAGMTYLKNVEDIDEKRHKNTAERMNRLGAIIGSATDPGTFTRAIMQAHAENYLDSDTARNLLQRGYDPAQVKQYRMMAMNGEQQATAALNEIKEKREAEAAAAQMRLHGLEYAAQTVPQDAAAWEPWRAQVASAFPTTAPLIPPQYSQGAYGLVRQFGMKPAAPPALMPADVLAQQKELHGSAEQQLWSTPGGLISILGDPNRSAADKARAKTGLDQHESLRKSGATQIITPNQNIQNESKLRDDYYRDTKDYVTLRNAYNKVVSSANAATAAGDMALIYGFMKLQDPGSTVREGERADAARAGSIPERIWALYNKTFDGETLTPNMRADFVARSRDNFNQYHADYLKTRDMYTGIAQRSGMDARNVVIDYSTAPTATVTLKDGRTATFSSGAQAELFRRENPGLVK